MSFSEKNSPWVGDREALVEIRDYSLWIKHIRGGSGIVGRLEEMQPGDTVRLILDGHRGVWEKMETSPNGQPTNGLKPLGEMRETWFRWFKERRGDVVTIVLGEVPSVRRVVVQIVLEYPRKEEQEAAFAALRALSGAGWRSEGAYGSRDELHDR